MSSSSSMTRIRALIPSSYPRRGSFPTFGDDIVSVARVLISEPHPDCRALLDLVVRRVCHDPLGQGGLAVGDGPGQLILGPASADGPAAARRPRHRPHG